MMENPALSIFFICISLQPWLIMRGHLTECFFFQYIFATMVDKDGKSNNEYIFADILQPE